MLIDNKIQIRRAQPSILKNLTFPEFAMGDWDPAYPINNYKRTFFQKSWRFTKIVKKNKKTKKKTLLPNFLHFCCCLGRVMTTSNRSGVGLLFNRWDPLQPFDWFRRIASTACGKVKSDFHIYFFTFEFAVLVIFHSSHNNAHHLCKTFFPRPDSWTKREPGERRVMLVVTYVPMLEIDLAKCFSRMEELNVTINE